MRNLLGLCLCATWGLAQASTVAGEEAAGNAAGGTVRGRVRFDGGDPPKGITVTDAVVYLTGEGLVPQEKTPQANVAPAVLDQKDIAFVPHVLPVMVNRPVEIRNGDAILHNIHTNSAKNNSFNRAQPAKGAFSTSFGTPEVIPVGCDIHSQMSAYIVVLPNPFFAKPAKDGTFAIPGIPPGKYQLVGWHEKRRKATATVEVGAGETLQADVNFVKTPANPKEDKRP